MRRLALRDLRSDEGLGLVETIAALMVFGLIMTGLAASMATFAHQTAVARSRSAAASLAQRLVEKARAVGYTSLGNCQGGGVPNQSQYRGDAILHSVAFSVDGGCLPYTQPMTTDGVPFTVTQLVLIASQGVDVGGQAINEKYLVVQISWTGAGSGSKSYELDTIVNNNGAITVVPAEGIRFVVQDTSGNIITASTASWDVQITDTTGAITYTDPDAATAEGVYSAVNNLTAGTPYICTINLGDGSTGYNPVPGTNQTLNADGSVSGPCSYTAGTVTDWVTKWQSQSDCASTAAKGSAAFNVTDHDTGLPLANANVTLTNVFGHGGTPAAAKTDSNGNVLFNKNVPGDWYTYAVTATNYIDSGSQGPICVVAGAPALTYPQDLTASGCPYSSAKGTLTVTVTDQDQVDANENAIPIAGATVTLTKITAGSPAAPGAVTTNAQGNAVFSNSVGGGSYTFKVTPPKNSAYQGSGVSDPPTCVTAGLNTQASAQLSTTGTCPRAPGTKGKLAFVVTDQGNRPVSNAVIHFININGDAAPGDVKTGANGQVTATLVDDPYDYTVTGPAGYRPSDVIGPQCVSGTGTTTVSVSIKGIMTLRVAVTNSDTALPWKTYVVVVTDPFGAQSSQTITVPSSGAKDPSTVTFTNLLTGTGYVVQLQAIQGNGNPNIVATEGDAANPPALSYPTVSTTYTLGITDAGGSSG